MHHGIHVAIGLALIAAPGSATERPPLLRGGLDSGWWIVVGSGPEPGVGRPSIADAVNAATARCGFSAFNDFSVKFSSFKPGYEVFVIGAYRSEREAARLLTAVRRCVPTAYLKSGSYAGE